ncbi:MAG: hypothetical protein ABIJ45_09475 [Candidatus Zixiibacteriota bacterium]
MHKSSLLKDLLSKIETIAEGAKFERESLTDISDPRARDIILDCVEVAV